jgi:hypothetical protein
MVDGHKREQLSSCLHRYMDELLTGKMKLLALSRGQQQAQAATAGRGE